MKALPFTTKTGKNRYKFIMSEEEFHALNEDFCGLCIDCGADASTCEPDASGYECEDCGGKSVCGLELLTIKGYVVFKEYSEEEEG